MYVSAFWDSLIDYLVVSMELVKNSLSQGVKIQPTVIITH